MSESRRIKRELEFGGFFKEDSVYNGMVGKAVMELVDVFSKQGHSGMSASIVSNLFNHLINGGICGELTGKDEEWATIDDKFKQNVRCTGLFKDLNGVEYYLDGFVFRDESGATWTNGLSKRIVKTPCETPKSIYIDVTNDEMDDTNKIVEKLKSMGYGDVIYNIKNQSSSK